MSSSEERSPKRQRRSYSPASPLPDPNKAPVQQPQTPPPSVHMSPSWQSSQLPGLGHHSASGASGGHAIPTPPSTAGLNSQMMARGTSNEGADGDSVRHTPTHEMDTETEQRSFSDADQSMGEARQSGPSRTEGSTTPLDGEHRRTDHEREELRDVLTPLPTANVLYKLSSEPIAPARPLFSQSVIELYDLQRIQASVARRNDTGAKINKLRKSYDGKVKDLGLEGRNKATKQEGWFTGFLHPGWDVQLDDGRTMWQLDKAEFTPGTDADEKLLGLLDKALDLRPGHLPNQEYHEWNNLLGLDDLASATKPASAANSLPPSRTASSSILTKTAPVLPVQSSAPVSPRSGHLRPERQGKKRRYDERSYEGYNDGYEDDGYDTGGLDESGRRGSGGKRQKRKDFTPSNSPPFSTTSGTGSGMVGVRTS